MTKKFVLTVELTEAQDGEDHGMLSVSWDKEGMSYAEMLGFIELAKDHIKAKDQGN